MPLLLEAREITYRRDETLILDRVSFSMAPKELVTLIGPNGAGKSTLLKLLLGIERPDEGEIIRTPGLRIGYVPQKFEIEPTLPLSVHQFLKLAPSYDPHGLERVEELLGKQLRTLSGGELQRVLLSRALFKNPDLLVMDEPTQGLDLNAQHEFYAWLSMLQGSLAILLVSHDLHLVFGGSSRVLCLNKHICCEGCPEDIQKNPSYQELFGRDLFPYHHHHTLCEHEVAL